jgi:hypothetical protein
LDEEYSLIKEEEQYANIAGTQGASFDLERK